MRKTRMESQLVQHIVIAAVTFGFWVHVQSKHIVIEKMILCSQLSAIHPEFYSQNCALTPPTSGTVSYVCTKHDSKHATSLPNK